MEYSSTQRGRYQCAALIVALIIYFFLLTFFFLPPSLQPLFFSTIPPQPVPRRKTRQTLLPHIPPQTKRLTPAPVKLLQPSQSTTSAHPISSSKMPPQGNPAQDPGMTKPKTPTHPPKTSSSPQQHHVQEKQVHTHTPTHQTKKIKKQTPRKAPSQPSPPPRRARTKWFKTGKKEKKSTSHKSKARKTSTSLYKKLQQWGDGGGYKHGQGVNTNNSALQQAKATQLSFFNDTLVHNFLSTSRNNPLYRTEPLLKKEIIRLSMTFDRQSKLIDFTLHTPSSNKQVNRYLTYLIKQIHIPKLPEGCTQETYTFPIEIYLTHPSNKSEELFFTAL